MSSGVDAAASVALFDALYTAGYCGLAATIVFFYDAFVTFDREVSCVWTAKWTGGSFLFIANKWISMLYYIVALVTSATFPSNKLFLIRYGAGGDSDTAVLSWVFSALRAFVLSKSKLVGILVLALSLAPVGANMVKFGYQVSGENISPFGCLGTDNETEALTTRRIHISSAAHSCRHITRLHHLGKYKQ
ncbi:hypothetical protein OH76DRAFT_562518 [Lentinus brumalis]|uniref:DUF6533 domain-containing protein n=1 Tax=Lentinus brumalis TaxID=2498619 RepID=A0A371D9N5_9APHY|nr:hypothetical protein OH76DRAFT_562518 [Polyporus brumalis]